VLGLAVGALAKAAVGVVATVAVLLPLQTMRADGALAVAVAG